MPRPGVFLNKVARASAIRWAGSFSEGTYNTEARDSKITTRKLQLERPPCRVTKGKSEYQETHRQIKFQRHGLYNSSLDIVC